MPLMSKVASSISEAMSIKFNNIVYELKRQGKKVITLSLGEAFFDIPLFPMNDLPYPDIYHYSHSRGLPELREKLSEYFHKQFEVDFDPTKEILVTAGSKIAIHMAFMGMLDPGDEVLIHEPAWVSYSEQIKLCYGKPLGVPYFETVFEFEKYISNRTKAIVINNPHNPTGKVYSIDELNKILELGKKYNLWLLSDEAYSDFLIDNSFVSLGALEKPFSRVVIFNSISKNYGISGWRLGYIIGNSDFINTVSKVNQHLITCPATILEYYVSKHFYRILEITFPQIQNLLKARKQIGSFMESIGLKFLPGEATFYFFVAIIPSKLTSEEFCERLLREEYVSVVPGIGYGASCDKFVRVSFGTESMDDIEFALKKVKELIRATS
ncbi:MAG: pyridoxal phosphate-dependent aminotransferase [Candidatus Riflebacteria bacterium]|nr:pyridoxal phosphate-dependent aminotransferase [Candidatus Riflebacteria bacterium]